VNPSVVQVPYNTAFSVNVTNMMQNESIWVFCLADANISRVDAPIFMTINASQSYLYRFVSPQAPSEDTSSLDSAASNYADTNLTSASTFSMYFGAVNAAATQVQTAQVTLQMTSVETLTYQLTVLILQNQQLEEQMLGLEGKANNNNLLIVACVASNVFWGCLLVAMRMQKPKNNLVKENMPEEEPTGTELMPYTGPPQYR